MRFVSIAVFLFCVHVSMAVVNSTGIFITTISPSQEWLSSTNQQQVQSQQYVPNQVQQSIDWSWGDVIKGVFFFVMSFGLSIVFLPWTFVQFGMSWSLAGLISAPFYLMYLFGWAQWLANRPEKNMS
jgi:hypothetical protein